MIASSVAEKVEKVSFEDYISELVEKAVHRELPEKYCSFWYQRCQRKIERNGDEHENMCFIGMSVPVALQGL